MPNDAQTVSTMLRKYTQRRCGNHLSKAMPADNLAALVEPLEKIITEECLTEFPGVARQSRTSSPSFTGPAPMPLSNRPP
jgi:hypothetical protein